MPRHHRKKHPQKWVKRSDMKRPCPSGKRSFAKPGEAKAQKPHLAVYRCSTCKQYHLADPVGRKERRRRAQEGSLT